MGKPQIPLVAVVDVPGSQHARFTARCARVGARVAIQWIVPDLALPVKLESVTLARALCIPLSIRGATPDDRFLAEIGRAILRVRARGTAVFVAAGSSFDRNLVADLPGAVSVSPLGRSSASGLRIRPRHRGRLRCSDLGTGSSGAALRAAALCALLHTRRLSWRRPRIS